MGRKPEKLFNDLEQMKGRLILYVLMVVVTGTLVMIPRGAHWGSAIRYQSGIWAFGTAMVIFLAGLAAAATGGLLTYYDNLRAPDVRSRAWIPWAGAGLALLWIASDKMLETHSKIGDMLHDKVPFLHHLSGSTLDGFVLVSYGILALAFTVAFWKGPFATSQSKKFLFLSLVLMALAFGHDATEDYIIYPVTKYVDFGDLTETLEKLCQTFASWALVATFVTTAVTVLQRIVREFSGTTERIPVESSEPNGEVHQ